MWKSTDSTILGRIQIVKTFVIPIFMYQEKFNLCAKRYSDRGQQVVRKGKGKVKGLSLICDLDKGGLKAPHLETIIKIGPQCVLGVLCLV